MSRDSSPVKEQHKKEGNLLADVNAGRCITGTIIHPVRVSVDILK